MQQKIMNNGDWFLADIVERADMVGSDKSNENRRCLTWTNTIIVNADSIEEAYDKAMEIGKKNYTTRYKAASGRICSWKVLGISSLVPIYEDIEDGAEIGFTNEGMLAVKTSDKLVKTKKELTSQIS